MAENRCYDADCADENCHNPEHYNYICFDPNCDEIHCTNSNHYDKQILREYLAILPSFWYITTLFARSILN